MGIYTSTERVERDGRLIAYAGERMSDEEAKRRGLIGDEKPKPAPKTRTTKPKAEK